MRHVKYLAGISLVVVWLHILNIVASQAQEDAIHSSGNSGEHIYLPVIIGSVLDVMEELSAPTDVAYTSPTISGDGQTVAYVGYSRATYDPLLRLRDGFKLPYWREIRFMDLEDCASSHLLSPTYRLIDMYDLARFNRYPKPETDGQYSLSADGRYVAFGSSFSNHVGEDQNRVSDIFLLDRETGEIAILSLAGDRTSANGASYSPSISADGRYVAFESRARNLTSDDKNGRIDIFVHDRTSGVTSRVSVASDGTQANGNSFAPTISADGRYVSFVSEATNLVPEDNNRRADVFVHDRKSGETNRVSVASDGSEANERSFAPSISSDGWLVVFQSSATNMIDTDDNKADDIFLHNRRTGETTRISVSSFGVEANGHSSMPSISADGRTISFASEADNLVANDRNRLHDIFVHDLESGNTKRVSVTSYGFEADGDSVAPSLSADGRYVVFESHASNLVVHDDNDTPDIFVHDQKHRKTNRLAEDFICGLF